MDTETIIKLIRDATDTDKVDAWHNGFWTLTHDELERFAKLLTDHNDKLWFKRINEAVASEREACARECDIQASFGNDDERFGARQCGNAIRARGNHGQT
jgi:hypothetical protein